MTVFNDPAILNVNMKMNKSDISQYYSGKTEPNQNKLFILGKALDVNESWLMGFDVPKEMNCNPLYNSNYMIELNAAHMRTDIEIPEGVDISEDDIMDDENF